MSRNKNDIQRGERESVCVYVCLGEMWWWPPSPLPSAAAAAEETAAMAMATTPSPIMACEPWKSFVCSKKIVRLFHKAEQSRAMATAKYDENMLLKRAITLCILEKHSMMVCYRFAGCVGSILPPAATITVAACSRNIFHIRYFVCSCIQRKWYTLFFRLLSFAFSFISFVSFVYTLICDSRAAARLCVHGSVFIHNK